MKIKLWIILFETNKCLKRYVVRSNAKPMRFKCQCTDYLPSFDDIVGIHDKISRNCIEKHTVTGLPRTSWSWHTRGTKFSRTCRRDVRGIQIVLVWRCSSVGLRGCSDQYRSAWRLLHTQIFAKITNTEMQSPSTTKIVAITQNQWKSQTEKKCW